MKQEILQKIIEGKNILLVGKTNSGKSYFIKNKIIPLFKQKNINVSYFEECIQYFISMKIYIYFFHIFYLLEVKNLISVFDEEIKV